MSSQKQRQRARARLRDLQAQKASLPSQENLDRIGLLLDDIKDERAFMEARINMDDPTWAQVLDGFVAQFYMRQMLDEIDELFGHLPADQRAAVMSELLDGNRRVVHR